MDNASQKGKQGAETEGIQLNESLERIQIDSVQVTDTTLSVSWQPASNEQRLQDYLVFVAPDDFTFTTHMVPAAIVPFGEGYSADITELTPGVPFDKRGPETRARRLASERIGQCRCGCH